MAFIPIRSFAGLTRLSSALDGHERIATMRRLAERTTAAAVDAGASVSVVTGDADVRAWAEESGHTVIVEPDQGGLDAAARTGITAAEGPWLVVHADLPLVTAADIAQAASVVGDGGSVLAPSYDGGTSLIGGNGPGFPFSYGAGSFRRHLAAAPGATVLVRRGLAIDLDRVRDLDALEAAGLF